MYFIHVLARVQYTRASTWSIEVILRKSENSWERLKTSMEHLKTSDIILRKCLHRGWLCIAQGVVMHKSYNQAENIRKQQRTSENSWLHRKTSKIIWYHPENNWGPIIDSLVQFEEDSNSRTKKWVGWIGLDRLFQTTPIPRSPDGDKKHCRKCDFDLRDYFLIHCCVAFGPTFFTYAICRGWSI